MPTLNDTGDAGQSGSSGGQAQGDHAGTQQAISIGQRGNLKALETTLRRQWRMGQNIVLCWSADERGVLVIFVPHYFLGNYCAASEAPIDDSGDNEAFIRDLISGQRRKTREELFAVSKRLDVAPAFIKLNTALSEEPQVLEAVEQVIKRYGLSYVQSRAVILFDIVDFSLYTPFEQASQLNSLSYSLNSAYNKLLAQGIEINFARTTTGDGYYVWNRDLAPAPTRTCLCSCCWWWRTTRWHRRPRGAIRCRPSALATISAVTMSCTRRKGSIPRCSVTSLATSPSSWRVCSISPRQTRC
ncbi:MAG: hypothetical protein R3E50_11315 [Halioglobus sp.]